MRILITGVGGPAGICFAKSLSQVEEVELFGADASSSESIQFLKKFFLIPNATDPFFIEELNRIIESENIEVVVPLVDDELVPLSANLDKIRCKVLMSPPSTIHLTADKARLYEALHPFLPKKHEAKTAPLPVFVKPKVSRGSRDIHIISDREELITYDENKYLIQELLEGPEVTVDALFDKDGKLVTAVPRVRLEIICGVSTGGKVVNHPEILEKIKKISAILKFTGPVNFQFMNSNEGFKLMEINARSSGGMGITINSGIDIPRYTYHLLEYGFVSDVSNIIEGEFSNFQEVIDRQIRKEQTLLN